jgi:arylformamidase
MRAAGIDAKAFPAEGKTHTTINSELGQSDDKPTQAMFEFLAKQLKQQ